MIEREINTLTIRDWPRAERIVEQVCANAGLWPSLKTGLAQYPGSVHWHFRREGARGVLEITLWPEPNRAWLAVHDNRDADWIPAMIEKIASELTSRL